MQELTIILFAASLVCGAASMMMKKTSSGGWALSLVLSVLAIGAALTDDSLVSSEGYDLTLVLVAPFVIMVYSVYGMLFGGRSRWPGGSRYPTC